MNETRLCPYCHSATPAAASHCWMCRSVLPAWEARAPIAARPAPTDNSGFFIWIFTSLVAIVMMFTIVVVLFLTHPGAGVAAATLCVPIVGALGAMVFRNRPGVQDRNTTRQVLGTAAFGIAVVVAIMMAFALLVVAAIVIVCILCFASMASGNP